MISNSKICETRQPDCAILLLLNSTYICGLQGRNSDLHGQRACCTSY